MSVFGWLAFVAMTVGSLGRIWLSPPVMPESQGIAVEGMRQDDLDDDGSPDRTTLLCSLATEEDVVVVYDGAGDMTASASWEDATDFDDDTWLFDAGSDGDIDLILAFVRDGDRHFAYVYDDEDGNGSVEYRRDGTIIVITESEFAPLVAEADGAWLRPDGSLNWNLRFHADGPSALIHHQFPEAYTSQLKLDGQADLELVFADAERDGVPEYGLFRLLAPSPRDWGLRRTGLHVNVGGHRPLRSEDAVFWPLLGGSPVGSNYFDSSPIVEVDWEAARITRAYLPGYPIEHGYHVNTLQYFRDGELNYADFEIAMAYYDLAGDQDGYPELHIRHRYYGANDPFGVNLPVPVNEIRWSWNQTNATGLSWDYKLGLAGRHTISEVVDLPGLSYLALPYDDLPTWVVGHNWDYGTFIAREGASYASSEGIYAWAPVETSVEGDVDALSRFLAGQNEMDLATAFQTIGAGWRGELAPDLAGPPRLYLSPVDGKLHLLQATQGMWRLDDDTEVQYANLNGDAYLDQWQYVEAGQVHGQLNLLHGYLIYAGDGIVSVKQAGVADAVLESRPPTDYQEWETLGSRLEDHGPNLAGGDLARLMDRHQGPVTQIEGAYVEGLRPTAEGFRFVLYLEPGFQPVEDANGLALDSLAPGSYLASYTDGFQVLPMTPARLSAQILPVAGRLHLASLASIQVVTRNDGLADAENVTLVVEAHSAQDTVGLVRQQADILAGQPLRLLANWQPQIAGAWELAARIEDPDGELLASAQQAVVVSESRPDGLAAGAELLRVSGWRGPIAGLLAAFAGLLGLAVRPGGRGRRGDAG